jgi:hypothetical protein
MLGLEHPENWLKIVLIYLGFFAFGLMALRITVAPFFVWRDEAVSRHTLEEKLKSPQYKIDAALADRRAKVLVQLSQSISEMAAFYLANDMGRDMTEAGRKFAALSVEAQFSKEISYTLSEIISAVHAPRDDSGKWILTIKAQCDLALEVIHDPDCLERWKRDASSPNPDSKTPQTAFSHL